ncbi:uncharacterized protein LOC105173304 isoform X3 [Sesamum indicum]|uniref:Uncharacterized protein LOC105173304 isoform X3 n=1 Tax=Sesamum indicum TaxID=4182 RepID=A0A8M8VB15_SESIN|nr:uncharacterized protein LOC105173304 isoform X3 [Sesamum indicum]
MAVQFATLNPLQIQRGISVSLPRRTQLFPRAAASVSLPWEEQIPPNALRRKRDPSWRGGFSLGVDLGLSRTGVALSKGFSIRPLTEVDEFIIGLPKSGQGNETEQSNKVRSVAGRLAVRAAERGWRVYLQDEHGTSAEALDHMIAKGLSRSAREGRIDAYAAVKVLERYFSYSGNGIELVIPKQVELQNKLRQGPPKDVDFFPDD